MGSSRQGYGILESEGNYENSAYAIVPRDDYVFDF